LTGQRRLDYVFSRLSVGVFLGSDKYVRIPQKRLAWVYVAFLIVTLLLIAGPKTEAQVKQTVSIKALTLGVVYQSEPQPVAEHFRPLVEYAARKLAPTGEIKSTVIVANNISRLIELVERVQVDFYLESPFPTYLINRCGTGKLCSDVGKAA
jgi:ABC-type phosphate/phosphonate transport system substrate-binding protein